MLGNVVYRAFLASNYNVQFPLNQKPVASRPIACNQKAPTKRKNNLLSLEKKRN